MKHYLPLLFLVVFCTGVRAQDATIFNHYVQNPVILNPAAVGFTDEYQVFINSRLAWTGFEDAPKTVALRANGPVGESFGVGASIFSESAAQLQRTKGQIDVAFRFGIGKEDQGKQAFQASFGFFTQFQRLTLDGDILNNPVYEPGDALIMEYLDGRNEFDAGVGLYGTYDKRIFGGFTINNLVSNRLDNISGIANNEGLNYTFLLGQHFTLKDADAVITPSVMFRNLQDAPFMLDFNVQGAFANERIIAGLSYRYLGAVGVLLGTNQRNFNLYYSFDLGFGEFQTYNSGSHEFTVGYRIGRQQIKDGRARRVQQENLR